MKTVTINDKDYDEYTEQEWQTIEVYCNWKRARHALDLGYQPNGKTDERLIAEEERTRKILTDNGTASVNDVVNSYPYLRNFNDINNANPVRNVRH